MAASGRERQGARGDWSQQERWRESARQTGRQIEEKDRRRGKAVAVDLQKKEAARQTAR